MAWKPLPRCAVLKPWYFRRWDLFDYQCRECGVRLRKYERQQGLAVCNGCRTGNYAWQFNTEKPAWEPWWKKKDK